MLDLRLYMSIYELGWVHALWLHGFWDVACEPEKHANSQPASQPADASTHRWIRVALGEESGAWEV